MLFYVSGAALLVHLELDHTHGPAVTAHAGCDAQHNTPEHAPARTPDTPTKKHCQLCDMLAGSTHPIAVVTPGQTIFFADAPAFVLLTAEAPADRHSAPDISRRGPPSLG
jgi:hypothetical protein